MSEENAKPVVPFSAMLATGTGTISFTHIDGKTRSVLASHAGYERVKELLDQINEAEDPDAELTLRQELFDLTQPAHLIAKLSHNFVKVEGGVVLYKDRPVHNVVAERILWTLEQEQDAMPMVRFLDKLFENPSYRAVNELFRFMEHNQMGITKDGDFLAYKRVRDDYKDIHSGTFDNSVGQNVSEPRHMVDDDPTKTCSRGLHLCSMTYLPSYGAGPSNRIVICKVHPKNVVSIPKEYGNAKMRVCEYDVVGEIDDSDGDILGKRAVFDSFGSTTFGEGRSRDELNERPSREQQEQSREKSIMERLLLAVEEAHSYTNVEVDSFNVNSRLSDIPFSARRHLDEAIFSEFDLRDFDADEALNDDDLSLGRLADQIAEDLGLQDRGSREGEDSNPTLSKLISFVSDMVGDDVDEMFAIDNLTVSDARSLDGFIRTEFAVRIGQVSDYSYLEDIADAIDGKRSQYIVVGGEVASTPPETAPEPETTSRGGFGGGEWSHAGGGAFKPTASSPRNVLFGNGTEPENLTVQTPQEAVRAIQEGRSKFEEARKTLQDLEGQAPGTELTFVYNENEMVTQQYIDLRSEFDDTIEITPLRRANGQLSFKASRR
jgi:hypothetical protein